MRRRFYSVTARAAGTTPERQRIPPEAIGGRDRGAEGRRIETAVDAERGAWLTHIEWVRSFVRENISGLHAAVLENLLINPLIGEPFKTVKELANQYDKTPKQIHKIYEKQLARLKRWHGRERAARENDIVLMDWPEELACAAMRLPMSDSARSAFFNHKVYPLIGGHSGAEPAHQIADCVLPKVKESVKKQRTIEGTLIHRRAAKNKFISGGGIR